MIRIPPNLLYLTIYNPTLRPNESIADEDDEDAEEQAHILFYTSKERAVSRDRMLRQVGLAKALVNFSEMFNEHDFCSSVHSQSRRMIMVSPEPDFWIHAGVEVAKAPRVPLNKNRTKGKGSGKAVEKEKGKQKEVEPEPAYDFHEGSVHDVALRQSILRGYERFKLTHGSFTSILSTLGQQALELQLERFFTVWAWSWNLEDGQEFSEHLGLPLHPRFRLLVPILDKYSEELPDHSTSIIISPPHLIPSSRYHAAQFPSSLSQHLLSLVPPIRESGQCAQLPNENPDATVKAKRPSGSDSPEGKDPSTNSDGPPLSTFLGMPANVGMDVTKWNWPGYLTFGRGTAKKSGPEEGKKTQSTEEKSESVDAPAVVSTIDTGALEDAMSSDSVSIASLAAPATMLGQDIRDLPPQPGDIGPSMESPSPQGECQSPGPEETSHTPPPPDEDMFSATTTPPTPPEPDFLSTTVHLADRGSPLLTERRKVYYTLHNQMLLALISPDEDFEPLDNSVGKNAIMLLDDIESALANNLSKSATDSLPSATRILQQTDSYIASAAQFTVSSPGFKSRSSHLYNAQELQAIDSGITEVFSRGQNPQHWHVAKSRVCLYLDNTDEDGEVFLEVFRKEASLADVDNVLTGVVRRCGLGE